MGRFLFFLSRLAGGGAETQFLESQRVFDNAAGNPKCFQAFTNRRHNMKTRLLIGLVAAVLLALAIVAVAGAVSGAAFTTFNAHIDGASKDVCKNSVINCNIYGAKEYVWLNGGPAAAQLPNGDYFFAVLAPGGQPDPNDGGAKNLSDDYDQYTNRTFNVTDGKLTYNFSDLAKPHWLDDGQSGPKPNW